MLRRGFLALIAFVFFSCGKGTKNEVVVYCTVDQVFSEPILKDFQSKTGITVRPVFDTEETKSTGVMNRLLAEQNNPQCDVFWSGDPVRNIVLKSRGITDAYNAKATRQIPAYFKDSDDHWTGFSARARVLIYNKKLIKKDSLPKGLNDLTLKHFKGRFAIANPLFGTTTFQIAALFTEWGDDKAKQWMSLLKRNAVIIASSNGDVKKRTMTGEILFGLTDTDDAFEAMKESADVDFIFLDQQPESTGTLVMPNALSIIKKSPNQENGKKLMEYLLSKETEAKLAKSCAQMPLIKGTEVPEGIPSLDRIIPMKVNYDETAKVLQEIQPWLKQWLEK
ncbi:MAG: extracellular solute-binding protein [Chryseolinea sp.]